MQLYSALANKNASSLRPHACLNTHHPPTTVARASQAAEGGLASACEG